MYLHVSSFEKWYFEKAHHKYCLEISTPYTRTLSHQLRLSYGDLILHPRGAYGGGG